MSMNITLELFGMARHLVRERSVRLELPDGARAADLIAVLAERHPQLVGTVIDSTRCKLIEPNILYIDGRTAIRDLASPLTGDAPLCLMFVAAGG